MKWGVGRGGGIGRRTGLKIPGAAARTGSTPVLGIAAASLSNREVAQQSSIRFAPPSPCLQSDASIAFEIPS